MTTVHPLQRQPVMRAIERAVSAHRSRPWTARGCTDLDDRASHPCGLLHGDISVFAKAGTGPHAGGRLTAELRGLRLLRDRTPVATPAPVGDGVVGPLHQDNRPVPGNRWADFYAERRLRPRLRSAVDSGHLPPDLARGVDRLIARLPRLCGREPRPSLLHGDAQQNNVLTTATGAVLIDVAPHFGHPELDLALLDYFAPVPGAVFDAYREVAPIDPGFGARRELWRLAGYLAVVTVDGTSEFGRPFLGRVADAVAAYR